MNLQEIITNAKRTPGDTDEIWGVLDKVVEALNTHSEPVQPEIEQPVAPEQPVEDTE